MSTTEDERLSHFHIAPPKIKPTFSQLKPYISFLSLDATLLSQLPSQYVMFHSFCRIIALS